MDGIAHHLTRIEARLDRVVGGGWDHADQDRESLGRDADGLAGLGLDSVAARLRAVADAADASAGLAAATVAAAACRLVRASLPGPENGRDGWLPMPPPEPGRQPAKERFLLLARLTADGEEVWACLRPRGGWTADLLLVTPPELALPANAPWLRMALHGLPRWSARYPLGGGGTLERCDLVNPEWVAWTDQERQRLAPLRAALAAGTPVPDDAVPGYALASLPLTQTDRDDYAWPTPDVAAAFAEAGDQPWGMAWTDGDLVVPLALVEPTRASRPARLAHLLLGRATDPLPDGDDGSEP